MLNTNMRILVLQKFFDSSKISHHAVYRCVMNDSLRFNATEQVAVIFSTSKDRIFILVEVRLVDMTGSRYIVQNQLHSFFNKKVYTK